MPQNPKFDVFNSDKRSVIEIASDETDFDAAIAGEADAEKRHRMTQASILQSRARTLAITLRQVWMALPLAQLAAA